MSACSRRERIAKLPSSRRHRDVSDGVRLDSSVSDEKIMKSQVEASFLEVAQDACLRLPLRLRLRELGRVLHSEADGRLGRAAGVTAGAEPRSLLDPIAGPHEQT